MDLKDTISGMTSEDYKERFIAEYCQAVIRARKLKNIIDDYETGDLKFTLSCPIELLKQQYEYMTAYVGCLVKRMKYEGIENLPSL